MPKLVRIALIRPSQKAMNLAHQNYARPLTVQQSIYYFPRKPESCMSNSNLIENDFKILLISLPAFNSLILDLRQLWPHDASIVYKTKGFHVMDAPGGHNVSHSALPKGPLGLAIYA